MNIYFHFQKQAKLEERNKLKGFIQSIFTTEKTAFALLNVIFCDDAYLLGINQAFLNHHYFTDVISFNLAENKMPVQGEIYISVDRVCENAKDLKVSFKQELHRVIFHGILHFCGYKDKTPGFQKQIRAKEDFYIDKYFS